MTNAEIIRTDEIPKLRFPLLEKRRERDALGLLICMDCYCGSHRERRHPRIIGGNCPRYQLATCECECSITPVPRRPKP